MSAASEERCSLMGCHRHHKGRRACAERSVKRSKRSKRRSRMGCRRRCEGRRACTERSIERSKQSMRFDRMGCRRDRKGRRACAERGIERNTRSERHSHTSCRCRWRERRAGAERSIEGSKRGSSWSPISTEGVGHQGGREPPRRQESRYMGASRPPGASLCASRPTTVAAPRGCISAHTRVLERVR